VLHTLGEDVIALGFAGGRRGEAMLADLDAAGIRHDFVRVEPETRQCITVIDRSDGSATELVEESMPIHPRHLHELRDRYAKHIGAASGSVLSGSLPPNFDDRFYLFCVLLTVGHFPVVLDARGEPLRQALSFPPALIAKLNREELGATVGRMIAGDADVVAAARSITTTETGMVVVTLGAEGAMFVDAREAWRVDAPEVETRSAVGSGDAFAAGLIAGLVRGQALPEAATLAAACGAANSMTDLAGHLSRSHVETLRRRVRVEPVPEH
jgi:tagatose 6-phosphate kinase